MAGHVELGEYSGGPTRRISILQGIKDKVGNRIKVNYAEGCKITTSEKPSWHKDDVQLSDPAQDDKRIAEAVQAARAYRPTVLFLDINMPVMGGMEALPLIREASPETAVVMVTGCVDTLQVTQAAGLGAVGYIIKPLRPVYVENFIRKRLGA